MCVSVDHLKKMAQVASAFQVNGGTDTYRVEQGVLNGERTAMGDPQPNMIQSWYTQNFQTAVTFGSQATLQIIPSQPILRQMAVVLEVSAIAGGGTPAFVEDASNFIDYVSIRQSGNEVLRITGAQICHENQLQARAIQALSALEAATTLHTSLAARQALAAGTQRFVIEIPGWWKEVAIPAQKLASEIQVVIQFKTFANCTAAGSSANSATITDAYMLFGFCYSPAGPDQLQPRIEDQLVANVKQYGKVMRPYHDLYSWLYNIANGTITSTFQLQTLRGLVPRLTFYVVADSDLYTAYAIDPLNYRQMTTFQINSSGNPIYTQAPQNCEVNRLYELPSSGVLNMLDYFVYGTVFDGASMNHSSGENRGVMGGGFGFGAAAQMSPNIVVTYPSSVAATLFIMVTMWNAIVYTLVGQDKLQINKLCV